MATEGAARSVVVLRHPARAVRIAHALRSAGTTPYALPITDTALPATTEPLLAGLGALGRGGYDWLVVTSGNAVRALELVARRSGTSLASCVRSGTAKVAAVGTTTAGLLLDAGVPVDLVPERASSTGLLDVFPSGEGVLLLPQADLAPDDLRAGLAHAGWDVRRIEAYRTVPYPAGAAQALPIVPEEGVRPVEVGLADVVALAAAGIPPAIVFMAPSAVGQFRERLGESLRFLPVALGRTTAEALRTEGWEPAATAGEPTPDGIAGAVVEAFSRASVPEPSNGDQS